MRTDNPCHGIKRFDEEGHERFLSEAEIAKLSDVLAAWPNKTVAAALRFLLLTGARRGEVTKATWDQFNFELKTWTKPSAHMKNKKKHVVPLSAPAREVLAGLPQNGELVFPGCGGLSKQWQRIRKTAGLEDVRLHDLRHTAASILATRGASLQVIGKLLGHTQVQTTERYSHIADAALAAAAESIGDVVSNAGKEAAPPETLRKEHS
jgi:integrase